MSVTIKYKFFRVQNLLYKNAKNVFQNLLFRQMFSYYQTAER